MSTEESDFLVIGSGIAGLLAAIELGCHGTVNIITKKERSDSNTIYAQGGIAVPIGESDSADLHIRDTINAGCGLCHPEVVDFVVRNGEACLKNLIGMGVSFSPNVGDAKHLDLGREGGHSARRIVHAKDSTGREIESKLLDKAKSMDTIRFFENHLAVDLVLESKRIRRPVKPDRCWGAYAMDVVTRDIQVYLAKATLLTTGGVGKVYLYTSNPDIATGDGIAMAYRAGARVANLEFVQFHPTCLYDPKTKVFLISEAVRGEGAVLRTIDGEAFMKHYHERADLAPRDIVARAADAEMKKRGDKHVLLDATSIGEAVIRRRFPNIYETCLAYGIDMTREPVPVVPAAHYMCGGVVTDLKGRTAIEGLLCAGEVACTGVHGANRLASNSLLEALVFANRTAETAAATLAAFEGRVPPAEVWRDEGTAVAEETVFFDHDWDQVRRLMWDYVGIVRSDQRLAIASKRMSLLREQIEGYYWKYKLTQDLIELRNIALVGELIITSAMLRRESRGLHYNTDCPEADDINWKRDTVI